MTWAVAVQASCSYAHSGPLLKFRASIAMGIWPPRPVKTLRLKLTCLAITCITVAPRGPQLRSGLIVLDAAQRQRPSLPQQGSDLNRQREDDSTQLTDGETEAQRDGVCARDRNSVPETQFPTGQASTLPTSPHSQVAKQAWDHSHFGLLLTWAAFKAITKR